MRHASVWIAGPIVVADDWLLSVGFVCVWDGGGGSKRDKVGPGPGVTVGGRRGELEGERAGGGIRKVGWWGRERDRGWGGQIMIVGGGMVCVWGGSGVWGGRGA